MNRVHHAPLETRRMTPAFNPFNIFLGVLLFALGSMAFAAEPINTLERGFFSEKPTGVAINGYDTVAYFTENKPVEGSDAYSYSWKGATWKFASQQNLERFKAEPNQYAPQYGGYCAYGVAQGNLVSVEPDQFSIIDGKLYLNYNASIQKKWKKDPHGFNKVADSKFDALLKQ